MMIVKMVRINIITNTQQEYRNDGSELFTSRSAVEIIESVLCFRVSVCQFISTLRVEPFDIRTQKCVCLLGPVYQCKRTFCFKGLRITGAGGVSTLGCFHWERYCRQGKELLICD